jgi:hypothetical protein
MHRDRDPDLDREPPSNEAALIRDLGLDTLFAAMAHGDGFILDVARRGVLASLDKPEAIVYRQRVLADCLAQPAVVRHIYDLAVEAIAGERKIWPIMLRHHPNGLLSRSVEAMHVLVGVLRKLRDLADDHAQDFRSDGFVRFFGMLGTELSDDYFETVEHHLAQLAFRRGVLVSADLGRGGKGTNYVLRRPGSAESWISWLLGDDRPSYTVRIADRDEAGATALSELRDRGIDQAADALAQSADHILAFFTALRRELGFYLGCLNVHDQLARKGEPLCFPVPLASGRPRLSARGLYDACLSLRQETRAVGNELNADGMTLVMMTGANEGGKSTFLRSIGVAQLMMQCGMLVSAESFRADISRRLFTHYRREEDATMTSGKLDEELGRMRDIVGELEPGCMVLFNESFASTNEREGSEIARQVIQALRESGIKVLFVTHLFDLAHSLFLRHDDTALFLRAERGADGRRTFRLLEGEPLSTSFGRDLYERIFGSDRRPTPAADAGLRAR